jgi:hypothetical protein
LHPHIGAEVPYCGFESQIAKSETQAAELDYQTYFGQKAKEKVLRKMNGEVR